VRQLEHRVALSTLYVDPTGIGPGGVSAYTTIQGAVNAAKSGSRIIVDPGTYTEDVTIAKNGIVLDGAKAGINPVPGRAGSESVLKGSITITGASVTVDGFTINSGEQWALEIGGTGAPSVNAVHALIADNTVNASIYGIQVGAEGGPGTPQVSLYADVQDNVVSGAAANIALFNTGNNTVQGNALSSAGLTGIDNYYSNYSAILGNTVNTSGYTAVRLRGSHYDLVMNNSGSGDASGASIEESSANNTILNNSFPPNSTPNTADASLLYVDPSGVGPGGLSAYTTIQAAVNAAASGQTIVVDAATYTENVTIATSGLTLVGAQAGINPVPGRTGGKSVLDGYITITGAGVTVDGFTVNSTGQWAIEVGGTSAPSVPAINCIIVDNIVNNTGTYGIQIGAEGGPCTTRVNLFAVVQDNVLNTANADIVTFNTGYVTVEGNLVQSSPTQFGSGIDVYYSNNDSVLGNVVNNAPTPTSPWYFAAIKLRGAHFNLIQDNTGTGDGQPAIFSTEGSSGNTKLYNDLD
jgi:parallel beta-helix repeat protein